MVNDPIPLDEDAVRPDALKNTISPLVAEMEVELVALFQVTLSLLYS